MERSVINVICVGNFTIEIIVLLIIREFILKRDFLNVSGVGKILLGDKFFVFISEGILERYSLKVVWLGCRFVTI